MLNRKTYGLISVLLMLLLASSPAVLSQEEKESKRKGAPQGKPVLWREPADVKTRNLLVGPGGEAMKPALTRVTFVEKKEGGTSTKYRVRDAAQNEWIAKLGKETQPETAANRLFWAVGFVTEIDYLVPRLTIEGKGTFENVRLEARPKDVDRVGDWKWDNNPFKGTPQFHALKIMMALINNWDLKDSNNEILAVSNETTGENELHYIISDLGGSFGKTGGFFSRSRNKPSDFIKARFIESVKGSRIDFNYGGKNKQLFEDITVEHARWLAGWLGQLSDEQLKDSFRAANCGDQDVQSLCAALRVRINELSDVAKNSRVALNRS